MKLGKRILLVNNKTIYDKALNLALKGYSYDEINFDEIDLNKSSKYDKIILSGGHGFRVMHPNKKCRTELLLLKKVKVPIFGICLGFELICRAYGTKIRTMKKYEKGSLKIEKIANDMLIKNTPQNFVVFENHHYIVTEVARNLIPLAMSKDGIEIIKHRTKPIWGVQFHPEDCRKDSPGRQILHQFLDFDLNTLV